MLPLHATGDPRPAFDGTGNAGLWYDKFCDTWRAGWTLASARDQSPKLSWIQTFAGDRPLGDPGLLLESVERLHQLTTARGGLHGVFVTDGRLVTGLGRSHPIENGLAWQPTLGVPYLPGSSIKGIVRSWAERDAGQGAAAPMIEHLFGSSRAPHAAGRAIFLDALPIAAVRLEADVMTPHHAGWAPGPPPSPGPPGDWRDPVPVPFLVVAPGTPFFFSILPRGIEPSELEPVFHWLRDALRHAGAGAKTAVGYGRFAHDEPRTRALNDTIERRRAARQAAARHARLQGTAEGRWLAAIEGKPEHEVLELVRIHLDKQRLADPAERRAFARAVAATDYIALWRKGEKRDKQRVGAGRDKLRDRARLVDDALSEADPEPPAG